MGRRESDNVVDRRGISGGGLIAGGGIGGLVLLVAALLFGVDPSSILQEGEPDTSVAPSADRGGAPAEDAQKRFVSVVLADTEDVWNELFEKSYRRDYREPKLVLFSGGSRSGCGFASSAVGPFYCPNDQTVYIDLQFFQELQSRFRAAGDFAQAYVVAHEIGHHVQKQIGVMDQVDSKRGRGDANQMSVRLELQADYLAGVWAHHAQRTKNILEPGDLEEALGAANAVGDDRLQKQARGSVVPDSFTHGTSAQRVRWFRLGFETGDLSRLMEPFTKAYSEL
jgi:predicted metalloprotease